MSVHPELFPVALLENGYDMHDIRYSLRQDLPYRRIRLRGCGGVLTILPSFIMPYWVNDTQTASQGLRLRYRGTSYDLISACLGKSPSHWERMETRLGHYSVVQTSCIVAQELPEHYVSDEKITFFNGSQASIAMTSSQECLWGIALSLSENQVGLQAAYGHFATECRLLKPDFAPKSVVIDGWAATRNAWLALFPTTKQILCFLHGVLKIGNCAKNLKEQWAAIKHSLWEAYKAEDAQAFLAKMDEFKTLAIDIIEPLKRQSVLDAIDKVWSKKEQYAVAYDFKEAYRTSNQVDRPMNDLDKYLYNTQYFHGNLSNAQLKLRAWALIHNFKPFGARTKSVYNSRFHRFNKVIYHEHWLQNLLIAAKKAHFQ